MNVTPYIADSSRDGLLKLKLVEISRTTTLTLSGEFDLSNIDAIETLLAGIACRRDSILVIDLSELEFIDSSAISVLLRADRRFNREGEGCVRFVCGNSPGVRRILELTGLTGLLPFVGDGFR